MLPVQTNLITYGKDIEGRQKSANPSGPGVSGQHGNPAKYAPDMGLPAADHFFYYLFCTDSTDICSLFCTLSNPCREHLFSVDDTQGQCPVEDSVRKTQILCQPKRHQRRSLSSKSGKTWWLSRQTGRKKISTASL